MILKVVVTIPPVPVVTILVARDKSHMARLKSHCKLNVVISNRVRIEKWLVGVPVGNKFNTESPFVNNKNTKHCTKIEVFHEIFLQ